MKDSDNEACSEGFSDPLIRNSLLQAGRVLLWAICFSGVSQIIKRELLAPGPLLWGVAALPTIVGIYMVFSYAGFLRKLDELHRLIELQGLAIAFGGVFLAITTYRILERLGAPRADIDDFVVVMMVLYAFGTVLGWRRYR
jgi:hypothetical protein